MIELKIKKNIKFVIGATSTYTLIVIYLTKITNASGKKASLSLVTLNPTSPNL